MRCTNGVTNGVTLPPTEPTAIVCYSVVFSMQNVSNAVLWSEHREVCRMSLICRLLSKKVETLELFSGANAVEFSERWGCAATRIVSFIENLQSIKQICNLWSYHLWSHTIKKNLTIAELSLWRQLTFYFKNYFPLRKFMR